VEGCLLVDLLVEAALREEAMHRHSRRSGVVERAPVEEMAREDADRALLALDDDLARLRRGAVRQDGRRAAGQVRAWDHPRRCARTAVESLAALGGALGCGGEEADRATYRRCPL
jgi:hypothetical protein